MSSIRHGSSHLTISGRSLSIPGFDINWVGECPWYQGICFGSEDGRILVTSRDGRFSSEALRSRPVRSGEPVNGVAFSDNRFDRRVLAISTRCDITLIEVESPERKKEHRIEIDWGARGVHATTTGRFIAPLGLEGVFVSGPNLLDDQDWAIQPFSTDKNDDPIMIYGLAPLGGVGQKDLFACAMRRDGIAPLLVRPDRVELFPVDFSPRLDVVDVCGMATDHHPYALVGLGADGSLHLLRDFLADRPLKSHYPNQDLGFNAIQGAAYSIRRAGDHLILLTSKGVYVFPNFVQRIVDSPSSDDETMEIYGFSVEAVGVFIVYDRLYLVLHDRTDEIPLSELIADSKVAPSIRPNSLASPETPSLDRRLESQPFQIQMTQVA